jgi:flagellar hook-associated protein 2
MGIGFVTLYSPDGDSVDIYIDDKNSSLRGIANQINQDPKSPVQASVIRDDSDPDAPYKILFSAKKEGDQNQIDPPDFYFMEGASDLYIDDDREAQNAELTIDGFDIELASNDVKDFLQGVNMHLKQARPDQPFTMTISEDYQKISGKVKTLVDQLNQVLQFIIKQNTIDEKTDTKSTFAGDTTLQTMEYRVRNLVHDSFGAENPKTGDIEPIFLNQIGVEFEKTGQLSFKEDKFNKALEDNFDMIAQAISGPDGFANKLKEIFDGFTRLGSGSLSVKEQGLRARIKQIDDQIDQKNLYLDKKKQAVVDQFSRLEGTLGNLQRQQQYLSATLGSAGGGNPITQLLGG